MASDVPYRNQLTVSKPSASSFSRNPSGELPAILGGEPVRAGGPPSWPPEDADVVAAVERCLTSGAWGQYTGPNHEELVDRLRAYHGCDEVILCSSGTAAIELALRGLRVGPGDEVVMAAYDFKGNFQNVLTVGATPVLIDLDRENWNLAPAGIEQALTSATRVILVSHLHGGFVPMPAVSEIARRHDLPVIEDACQMPGARICGRIAGTWGDVGILSFGGSKLLSAGRGGALLTNRKDIAQRIRLYTQRGNEAYPLSELQAAVLLPQLDKLDARNETRAINVEKLCDALKIRPGLTPFQNPQPPAIRVDDWDETQPGYYKLGLQYARSEFDGLSRDEFARAMRAEGVAIDPGFRALHTIHSRRRFRSAGDLPVADEADAGVLTLHHPVLLEDSAAIDEIAAALDKIRHHATMIVERQTQNA